MNSTPVNIPANAAGASETVLAQAATCNTRAALGMFHGVFEGVFRVDRTAGLAMMLAF